MAMAQTDVLIDLGRYPIFFYNPFSEGMYKNVLKCIKM